MADDTLRNDEARATVAAGARRVEVHVAHASGTVSNPMSDAAIEAKFLANATPVIGAGHAQRVCDSVWSLEKTGDMRELIALLTSRRP